MFKFAPVLAFVAAVATVSAAPLVLNGVLLVTGHDHVAKLHHVTHVDRKEVLRFVHLLPRLGHAHDFGDGFASRNTVGGFPKTHAFLNVAHDELFVELLGLSDCKTWHGTLLGVDGPNGLVHRAFGWAVDFAPTPLGHGVVPLAAFLFGRFPKEHFVGLVEKGLPAHPLTTALHKLLK